jgi:hypothetical protein
MTRMYERPPRFEKKATFEFVAALMLSELAHIFVVVSELLTSRLVMVDIFGW